MLTDALKQRTDTERRRLAHLALPPLLRRALLGGVGGCQHTHGAAALHRPPRCGLWLLRRGAVPCRKRTMDEQVAPGRKRGGSEAGEKTARRRKSPLCQHERRWFPH